MTELLLTEEMLHRKLQTTIRGAVWGYVRVSSAKQEDGQSPEAQYDAILAYCVEKGLDPPVAIVQEAASAGQPLFNVTLPGMKATGPMSAHEAPRPLLALLLAGLTDRPDSHFIVWKLDRLARVAIEQDMFLNLLRRHKVTLHSAYASERHLVDGTNTDVGDDPIRHLMRQVLACFAEYERHLIHLRMRMGAAKKASKGGWMGGNTPYGYDTQAAELQINPVQADRVRLIFFLRFVHQYTYINICSVLNQGLPVGEKRWHKVRVMRVLRSQELYEGLYQDPSGVKHARPDLIILPVGWTRDFSLLYPTAPPSQGIPA